MMDLLILRWSFVVRLEGQKKANRRSESCHGDGLGWLWGVGQSQLKWSEMENCEVEIMMKWKHCIHSNDSWTWLMSHNSGTRWKGTGRFGNCGWLETVKERTGEMCEGGGSEVPKEGLELLELFCYCKTKISMHFKFSTTIATFLFLQPNKSFWGFVKYFWRYSISSGTL